MSWPSCHPGKPGPFASPDKITLRLKLPDFPGGCGALLTGCGREESHSLAAQYGGGPVVGAKFAVDVLYMLADGPRRDAQPPGYCRGDHAVGHQAENCQFTIGDGNGIGAVAGSARSS